jgi:hypothetical protein
MNIAEIDDIRGTVVLRGHTVDINSDIGATFITDVCRHVENLLSAEQLRAKYGLADEAAWAGLAENTALQRAIAAAKVRRIHNGDAVREKAAHLLVQTIDIIGDIAKDAGCPPRSRIEASRELRQVAAVGADDAPAAEKERFHISINFGTAKIVKEIELAPKPEVIEVDEHEGEYDGI